MRKTFTIASLFVLLLISSSNVQANNDVPPVLLEVEEKISSVLNKIDSDLSHAAEKISKVGIQSPEAREILHELCKSNPLSVDCAIVDMDGMMVVLEPERYRKFEGADISKQEQVIRIHKTRKPVLSRAFRAVEGFDAVDLEYPVFSHHSKMKGSVSMLIRPESILSQIITPAIVGFPVDIWVMETEGRILFDPDEEEIGRNLFQDPIYKLFKQLLLLGEKIKNEHSGSGTYEFLGTRTKKRVTKKAYWSTVGLHGTEWRVVVTQVLHGDSSSVERGLSDIGLISNEEALRKFAGDKTLQDYMDKGEDTIILDLFKKYYESHTGIYSVQWIDAKGVNRYGYPKENSLADYDYHSKRKTGDEIFLKAIDEKRETSFDIPLVEGGNGHFFLVPVYHNDKFLGMVYTIRVVP